MNTPPNRRLAILAVAASITTWPAMPVAAQTEFPKQKPITLVVPFAPGGGNDILARAIAPRMSQLLGQTVVVDNRPGAGGNLGTELVARAQPDGYTIVIASSQVTMNPFLDMKVPFRIEKDFEPIGRLASVPLLLVANPQEPYKNLQDFMSVTSIGTSEKDLRPLMKKPTSALTLAFSEDPMGGIATDRFDGQAAVVFLDTVSFVTRTAALHQ